VIDGVQGAHRKSVAARMRQITFDDMAIIEIN